MATNKPNPLPCPYCKRAPVVVKIKAGRYRVACPYLDCKQIDAVGRTETEAVEKWDEEVIKA